MDRFEDKIPSIAEKSCGVTPTLDGHRDAVRAMHFKDELERQSAQYQLVYQEPSYSQLRSQWMRQKRHQLKQKASGAV